MAKTKIPEDKNRQNPDAMQGYRDLMTDEEFEKGRYYSSQYHIRAGELDTIADKLYWSELEDMFRCYRAPNQLDPFFPNNMIPLITPTVEGQTAHMTTSDMDVHFVSNNPAHETYMRKLDAAFQYTQNMGRFMSHLKDAIRDYLLLGGCWLTCEWERAYGRTGSDKPKGYAKVSAVPIRDVIVDGRIKDFKDLQQAEYIIHRVGSVPISYIRKEYGDKYADTIIAGRQPHTDEVDEVSIDDQNSVVLLYIWHRSNDKCNLQLLEMDTNGLVLRESDPDKPYYKEVDNEYPFAFARGMPISGSFYGFGDGLILRPMQKAVNKLTDELELGARFNAQPKWFVDENADLDPDDLTSDPSQPIYAKNPNQNIRVVQGQGVSVVVQNMIDYLLREAQRATRFSDIMTGMSQAASQTATATQNRVLQSSIGINDKKADIVEIIKWAAKYAVKLSLEKWDAPFWVRVGNVGGTSGINNTEQVDMGLLSEGVPASMPASPETLAQTMENNPDMPMSELPRFENILDEQGNLVYADIDFDVDVVISNNIPRGKSEMYMIVEKLMQTQVMTKDGRVVPFMEAEKARELIEHYIGIPMRTAEDSTGDEDRVLMPQNGMNPMSGSGAAQQMNGLGNGLTPSNAMGVMPGTTNQNQVQA